METFIFLFIGVICLLLIKGGLSIFFDYILNVCACLIEIILNILKAVLNFFFAPCWLITIIILHFFKTDKTSPIGLRILRRVIRFFNHVFQFLCKGEVGKTPAKEFVECLTIWILSTLNVPVLLVKNSYYVLILSVYLILSPILWMDDYKKTGTNPAIPGQGMLRRTGIRRLTR